MGRDRKLPANLVLLCFIDPRVRKIRNEASSCPGIFSRTLHFYCVILNKAKLHTCWSWMGEESNYLVGRDREVPATSTKLMTDT